MNALQKNAVIAITNRTNLSTGLGHPNDMNAAKEMFIRLHHAGEILLASEISSYASTLGWEREEANSLGALAEQIGMGKIATIADGPWWKDDIIDVLRNQ